MAQRAAPRMPWAAPAPAHCWTLDTSTGHSSSRGCARLSPTPAPGDAVGATGRRSSTSSPERDQTLRAEASEQTLPPPWETTQQHSRYLPG